ncbi:MAG TPA: YceD family protein [Trichocoleus sp.]
MKPNADVVYIPNLLQAKEKTKTIEIETHFPELETLTPVRGEVTVTHQGTYLDVKGKGEAIVTLTCHRCLQNYNHRLSVSPRELIWLQEPDAEDYPLEREVAVEDLVETLPPDGYFNPQSWLYEQLCLALPQQQLCSEACQGIPVEAGTKEPDTAVDHRWAALAQLRNYLPPDEDSN